MGKLGKRENSENWGKGGKGKFVKKGNFRLNGKIRKKEGKYDKHGKGRKLGRIRI